MSAASRPGPEDEEMRTRLLRLEELQLFSDRTMEQLHGEVLLLGRRITELLARIDRLERRFDQAQAAERDREAGAADDPPA